MADTYRDMRETLPARAGSEAETLLRDFRRVRAASEALVAPLSPEDQMLQSMPDASPTKWHLAHTSWFFETFILEPYVLGYTPFAPAFRALFNSYYNAVGPQHRRDARGILSRPSLDEVMAYRAHVDECIALVIESADTDRLAELAPRLRLGLNHEEQHQELILTDILHAFAQSPLRPAYRSPLPRETTSPASLSFVEFDGGLVEIGHDGDGFAFDNESPRHRQWLSPFRLASRPVSNREWLEFMADRGYERPELWLSDGWSAVQSERWSSPLYWERREGEWLAMTLQGLAPLDLDAPVAHLSFYEADAFARWAGKRLPTEAEWERAAASVSLSGNFASSGHLRPMPDPAPATRGLRQMFGDVWEWTQSAYAPYPGFEPASGGFGEYNGKFMANQFVLRGGSCVTPAGHVRATYRNFFYPHQRWQFSGLRLAEDARRRRAPIALAPRTPEERFRRDAIEGLSVPQKSIPSKYFYDAEGSRLFDEICALAEYYVPAAEAPLLAAAAGDLARLPLVDGVLVELGSGSSIKTRVLLDALSWVSAYVPLDISHAHMEGAARALARDYPSLAIHPVPCDFTQRFELPPNLRGRPALVFFPGSTIGNFAAEDAVALLRSVRASIGGGWMLVGVDLVKDVPTLLSAYNDPKGVTAAFNLNLLARLNRELGAGIDIEAFRHNAVWNAEASRIEMHLVCTRPVSFEIAGRRFSLEANETIHTENSHKYTVPGFADLAAEAGWQVARSWIGEAPAYAMFLLQA